MRGTLTPQQRNNLFLLYCHKVPLKNLAEKFGISKVQILRLSAKYGWKEARNKHRLALIREINQGDLPDDFKALQAASLAIPVEFITTIIGIDEDKARLITNSDETRKAVKRKQQALLEVYAA